MSGSRDLLQALAHQKLVAQQYGLEPYSLSLPDLAQNSRLLKAFAPAQIFSGATQKQLLLESLSARTALQGGAPPVDLLSALAAPGSALNQLWAPVMASLSSGKEASRMSYPGTPVTPEESIPRLSSDWTDQEDALLKTLITEFGTSKWSVIASKIGTKSNKQCRRRWQASLNVNGNKGSWTPEEDSRLIEGHRMYGNRWTDIARLVPGRTDNAAKNRFASLVAKTDTAGSQKVQRWSSALCAADTHSKPAQSGTESCHSAGSGIASLDTAISSVACKRRRTAQPAGSSGGESYHSDCFDASPRSTKKGCFVPSAVLDLNSCPGDEPESPADGSGCFLDLNTLPLF